MLWDAFTLSMNFPPRNLAIARFRPSQTLRWESQFSPVACLAQLPSVALGVSIYSLAAVLCDTQIQWAFSLSQNSSSSQSSNQISSSSQIQAQAHEKIQLKVKPKPSLRRLVFSRIALRFLIRKSLQNRREKNEIPKQSCRNRNRAHRSKNSMLASIAEQDGQES